MGQGDTTGTPWDSQKGHKSWGPTVLGSKVSTIHGDCFCSGLCFTVTFTVTLCAAALHTLLDSTDNWFSCVIHLVPSKLSSIFMLSAVGWGGAGISIAFLGQKISARMLAFTLQELQLQIQIPLQTVSCTGNSCSEKDSVHICVLTVTYIVAVHSRKCDSCVLVSVCESLLFCSLTSICRQCTVQCTCVFLCTAMYVRRAVLSSLHLLAFCLVCLVAPCDSCICWQQLHGVIAFCTIDN